MPADRRQPHIFISFKTEKRSGKVAADLKTVLEDRGFSVWWQEDLQCGSEWHGAIDTALLRAGCVIVLWSPESIVSPWVRHEASQAVARGVYTPVRLDPMEIASPFDRIQATDLFHWKGKDELKHPGLLQLLDRADKLIPPTRSLTEKVLGLLTKNRVAVLTSLLGAAAVAMLVRLSFGLEAQLQSQTQISDSIQRTLHPLSDFRVTAFIEIPADVPGVKTYLERLSAAVPVETLRAASTQNLRLPAGVRVSRSRGEMPVQLDIEEGSPLWPRGKEEGWIGEIARYMELKLGFSVPSKTALADFTSKAWDADLGLEVGAYDPDGSGGRRAGSISWDTTSGKLVVMFADTTSQKAWRTSGRIVSVPDLEKALLLVSFGSTMFPNDPAAKDTIESSRQKLVLDTFFLNYSGREVMIRASGMAKTTGVRGMPTYSGLLNDVVSKKE